MTLNPRRIFHSVPSRDGKGWAVEERGQVIAWFPTQLGSEADAEARARAAHAAGGLSQVILHSADGRIREERTYGEVPRKTPS